MLGAGCGVLAGLLGSLAVYYAVFWLFCAATFFGGVHAAVVLSFRFAAADCAAPTRRPPALSAVMAGGVFAGVIRPQLVQHTMGLWAPHLFAATYPSQAAVAALTGAASAVGLLGVDVTHFWATLILLGIGWNFGFVGASAMVLECHRPEEKTRVQSFNDFAVFGTMAIGSFLSGGLLSSFGWDAVVWLSFAPLLMAVTALRIGRRIAPQAA